MRQFQIRPCIELPGQSTTSYVQGWRELRHDLQGLINKRVAFNLFWTVYENECEDATGPWMAIADLHSEKECEELVRMVRDSNYEIEAAKYEIETRRAG